MNRPQQVIAGFRDVYNKMVYLNNREMKDRFAGYTSAEVHCIEYIGQNNGANVTRLAAAFYMTRGAMSKMTRKLMQKGAVESYQKPANRKEVYFRLTGAGKKVFETHEKLHGEFEQRDSAVFEQVSAAEWEDMLRFVERYGRHLDREIEKLDGCPE